MNRYLDRESLTNTMSRLLNDESTSDFRIKCRGGRTFHVHKFVLSLRSEYFQKLFASPHLYRENETNELNLSDASGKPLGKPSTTDDDDHPILVLALLKYLYTDDIPWSHRLEAELGVSDEQSRIDETVHYFVRISQLADRFLVKDIDTIVADRIFDCATTFDADVEETLCGMHTDDEFLEAIRTIYSNAKRSRSAGGMSTIVGLMVDYVHYLRTDDRWNQLFSSIEGFQSAILDELLQGRQRLMCIYCKRVFRGLTGLGLKAKAMEMQLIL